MKVSASWYRFFLIILIISTIFVSINPVCAVEFTRLKIDGIASNSISNTEKITVVPASLDISVVSSRTIHQQRAIFSGILTIGDQEFEVEGTIYTHDFQLTSMMKVSQENIFYKMNFAQSGYLIGVYKDSVISCHGRYGDYVVSFKGAVDEYPTAQFAPFWE